MTIYRFGKENTAKDAAFSKDVLGGKGYGLAEMAKLGLPVPPGFTIPCEYSVKYHSGQGAQYQQGLIEGVMEQAQQHLNYLKDCFGYLPLVSVRSGARVSMPGMMDTILNVGLTLSNFQEWVKRIGPRAAADSGRRLIQMYGSVVNGIDHAKFEAILTAARKKAGVHTDAELTAAQLNVVYADFRDLYVDEVGHQFPDTLEDQLRGAIEAVFKSWNNDRAIEYRKIHGYADDWGTAVNVQAMVFGNMNDASATGVLFTRCPATGELGLMGEFLVNAQGEDVVAGIRTPDPLANMAQWNKAAYAQLMKLAIDMEQHFNDMQDMEFTVQDGELFILQTRNAKRSAAAAVKVAYDFYDAGRINAYEMFQRVKPEQVRVLLRPAIDPAFKEAPHLKGIPAGGGVVSGQIVFADHDPAKIDGPVVLVAKETTPDDIALMNKAVGILTATGGATSHAAVVARGLDKSCVVGAMDLDIDKLVPGKVTIDGATGNVWFGIDVPIIEPKANKYLAKMEAIALNCAGAVPRITPTDEASYEDLVSALVQHKLVRIDAAFVHEAPANVLDAIAAAETQVILDLRQPVDYLSSEDQVLEFAFGQDAVGGSKLVAQLAEQPGLFKGKVVLVNATAADADLLADLGYKLGGKKAETVTDLINDEWVNIDPPTIKKLFGNQAGYAQFLKLLEAAGKQLQAAPVAKYPRRALLDNLYA